MLFRWIQLHRSTLKNKKRKNKENINKGLKNLMRTKMKKLDHESPEDETHLEKSAKLKNLIEERGETMMTLLRFNFNLRKIFKKEKLMIMTMDLQAKTKTMVVIEIRKNKKEGGVDGKRNSLGNHRNIYE
jgi:hypothetical protein